MSSQPGGNDGHGDQQSDDNNNGGGLQPGDLIGCTPDEIEALQAMLILRGQPALQPGLTAPPPLLPVPAPYNPPPSDSPLQHPAPLVAALAPQQPLTAADVQAEMNGNLSDFVTHALMTTTFPPYHYTRGAQVANRFGGRPRLQDALIALDYADWDLGGAIQQLEHDDELRQAAAAAGPEPAGPDPNRGLDRARASGGPNWDKNKLKLQINVGGRWKYRNYLDVDWTLCFKANDPSPRDLLRLNRWRHRLILDLAGPPRRLRGPSAGEPWHEATLRDLRRRIKRNLKKIEKNPVKQKPDYGSIMKAHNGLFKGLKLPGQVQEVPQRTYGSVSATIERKWKDDKYTRRGGTMKAKKGLKAIREEEREEADRCEKTKKKDFSSTLEELDEVEKETLVLESDWEEDETDDEDD